jgi:hypothetical protein
MTTTIPVTEPLTACGKCANHRSHPYPTGGHSDVCMACPVMRWDPVQGCNVAESYRFCGEVNTNGRCPHFRPRPSTLSWLRSILSKET